MRFLGPGTLDERVYVNYTADPDRVRAARSQETLADSTRMGSLDACYAQP
jgi:hypothetical protein